MNQSFPSIALIGVLALFVLSGCDARARPNYRGLELIDVSGNVTLDGQPLAGAIVTFTDTENRKMSYAQTDDAGNYELHFDKRAMGILSGEKVVEFSMEKKIFGFNTEDEGAPSEEGASRAKKTSSDPIPKCYREKSKIVVNVTGEENVYNFNLKSDGSTTGAS